MTITQHLTHEGKGSYLVFKGKNKLLTGREAPSGWPDLLRAMFPAYIWYPFSQPHKDLWNWADAIEQGGAARPFVAIWPRNRGKSTHAEMLAAVMGARHKRQYCLYVCETQEQADKHVGTIQSMLESDNVGQYYPDIGRPYIGKHGSKSWRRSLLKAKGYSVEAIGLDKAIRGQKIDWARPDLIIFDDIDGKHDTEAAVKKKQDTITTSILPAGAENVAILFVQNIIHAGSIAHRLSKRPDDEGAADYLADRIISGPYQAVDGLAYEFVEVGEGFFEWHITSGRSLWEGFTIATCEAEITTYGPTSFELESQHEIDTDDPNALLSTAILDATRVSSHPDLAAVGVAVDPSGGTGQCGIIGGGVATIGREQHGFTIADASTPVGTSSARWAEAALRLYNAIRADCIIVERNFGGDMVENTIRTAVLKDSDGEVILKGENVKIIEVNASRGKEVRAQPVSSLFELGKWHHLGRYPELQRQWTQWIPGTKPSPDRLDAEVWLATHYLVDKELPAMMKQAHVKGRPANGRGRRTAVRRIA